jgi:cytochrome b
VWDVPVRVLHWTLALSVLTAWVTTERFSGWHEPAGWMALAAVVLRVAWGWVGGGAARFGSFVRGPMATVAYAHQWLRGREPRYIGHNPLGAWMVVVLLGLALATTISGALLTTDRYWGDEAIGQWHRGLAWGFVGLVPVHVMGVLMASWRHRENLVRAMLDGRKRAPGEGDVGEPSTLNRSP